MIDHGVMVSSALKFLSQSVVVSSDKVVTLATPALPATQLKSSMTKVFSCKLKHSEFSQLSEVAFVHLHLAHYRNQLLHLFVEDAMVSLCLDLESDYGKSSKYPFVWSLMGEILPADTISSKFFVLHLALASEFVVPQKPPGQVRAVCVNYMTNPLFQLLDEGLRRFLRWGLLLEKWQPGGKVVFHQQLSHSGQLNFLRGLLLPFASGVWVVCNHLLSLDGGVQSLTAAVKAAQWLSAKCLKQGAKLLPDLSFMLQYRRAF